MASRGQPGRALIQTWQPDHPVMRALLTDDVERFYRTEIEGRRRVLAEALKATGSVRVVVDVEPQSFL